MPSNYSELQADVADWLNRDDLGEQIVKFIQMAEARFNRDLWAAEREGSVDLTLSSEETALPDDFSAIRSLYIDADPKITLEPMSPTHLREAHAGGMAGQPCNYAVVGGDTLVVAPVPDETYTLKLNYYRTIPALSDASPENWLLAAHPDLYLNSSLVEACLFLRDYEGAQFWEAKTTSAMRQLETAGRYKAHGGRPSRLRAPYTV